MITAGIDAGSRAIKVVLYDHTEKTVLGSGVVDQGIDQPTIAVQLFAETLRRAGLDPGRVANIVATGYGRNRVAFAKNTITEISCHAAGVHHLCPSARSIIEVGGQDSKVIRLDTQGRVRDFAMNDRCAAGTGRFLEMLASRLGSSLPDLELIGRHSDSPTPISSTCAVFAETEITGLLAEGVPAANICAGVQKAVAQRVAVMAGKPLEVPAYFTGGVALLSGMLAALSEALSVPVQAVPEPQFTGALGAAILAGRDPL